MMADVMLIGEPMVVFYANDYGPLSEVNQFSKGLAGAEVNVGIGLSRLGHPISFLTKLSNDEMGKYIFNCLQKEKFALSYTLLDEQKPMGIMFKNKVKNGDPETMYYRNGSAVTTLSVKDVEAIDFKQLKVLHLTGIPIALSESLRETIFYLINKARENDCVITFDPNLRPILWDSEELMIRTINEVAALSDVFLPGLGEAKLLTGLTDIDEISDFYLAQGVTHIVLKQGSDGAYVKGHDNNGTVVKGFEVNNIVDTVGAGDGFAVGIIDGILRGLTMEEACENANAIGAIQIQDVSDNDALPYLEDLEIFKAKYNR